MTGLLWLTLIRAGSLTLVTARRMSLIWIISPVAIPKRSKLAQWALLGDVRAVAAHFDLYGWHAGIQGRTLLLNSQIEPKEDDAAWRRRVSHAVLSPFLVRIADQAAGLITRARPSR